MLTVSDILGRLPHRPPFLLIDGVTELETGRRAHGWRCVTGNDAGASSLGESGCFPDLLVLEGMAQMAAIALWSAEGPGADLRLASIANVRFTGASSVGDRLDLEAVVLKKFGNLVRVLGKASVRGALLVQADLTLYSGREQD